jgi:flagellar biosynthesis protein FlhB
VSEEQGEKSFDPTPKRREQFRKDGRFARSKDAGGVVSTAAAIGVLLGSRAAIGRSIQLLFMGCFADLGAVGRHDADGVTSAALTVLGVLVAPTALAAAVGATAAGVAQAGLHVNLEAVGFKPERLNPLPRLQQLFSPKKGSVQALLSLLRVGLVGYVGYRALLIELPDLLSLSRVGVDVGATHIMDAAVRVLLNALFALALVSGVEYVQSRFSISKEMKMTRREVMDENRSSEGDQKSKARMRSRARALARKRSIANVKGATVVVANPTHISVALRYSPTDPAPVVVAKGHDDVALQIRAEARKHGIPILENRALARALDAEVHIGQPIPAAHFAAVARILAFVFKLRGVATAQGVRGRGP